MANEAKILVEWSGKFPAEIREDRRDVMPAGFQREIVKGIDWALHDRSAGAAPHLIVRLQDPPFRPCGYTAVRTRLERGDKRASAK